eukprot:PhF_6_TR4576/c0_g1_i1/m.6440
MVAYAAALYEAGEHNLSFAWLTRAASLGDTLAAFKVAECYNEGRGVPRDTVMASQYYQMAAAVRPSASPKNNRTGSIFHKKVSVISPDDDLPPAITTDWNYVDKQLDALRTSAKSMSPRSQSRPVTAVDLFKEGKSMSPRRNRAMVSSTTTSSSTFPLRRMPMSPL